jgi:hypothetical protein
MIEFNGPLYNLLQHFKITIFHCTLSTSDPTSNWTLKVKVKVKVKHTATDDQSVGKFLSSQVWGSWPDILVYYCLTVTAFFRWGALSDDRTGPSFYMLLVFASAIFLRSESLGTRDHILLSQIPNFPFLRLLRLAGSRRRYSTPPPNGLPNSLLLFASLIALGRNSLKIRPLPSNGCFLLSLFVVRIN